MSVTAPDLPYKDMADHCETLLMGKQKRMSNVMSSEMKQEESLILFSPKNHGEEAMVVISGSYVIVVPMCCLLT